MDDVRLPFTMNATVTFGDPPEWNPLPDPLPPDWIRIPVSFAVYLPVEIWQRAMREGWTPALAEAVSAQISIVPHSLRLGTGPKQDGDRTWQDFDALFDALHDGSASPALPPVDSDALVAAKMRDPHPVLPVPAPLKFDTAPVAPDFDAFLDFMGDPDRHPPVAPSWPAAHGPGPVKSAPAGAGGTGTVNPVSKPLAVLPKVTAAGEMGLGAAMTTVGTGEIAFGVATAPEVIGVPIAAEGAATTSVGIGLYEDGLRRWNHADGTNRTAHVDPRPPTPPLVPPVVPPPTEGFSTDPKVAQLHSLITTPVQPGPRNEGLVVEPPQGPAVVTIFGDGKPEKIWQQAQDQHTPGAEGYDPTRSDTLHPDPQALLDAYSGRGQPRNKIPRGQPALASGLILAVRSSAFIATAKPEPKL